MCAADTRLHFSAESLAHVEPFAGPGTVKCPRCRRQLVPGEASVRCPICGVAHHQTAEMPCWTYAPACAAQCGQPTALDVGYSWIPEGD